MHEGGLMSLKPERINDQWMTPDELYDQLHAEFAFGCDVAASMENTRCEYFIDRDDDALTRDWGEMNWCNPPYSKIKVFVEKAIEQSLYGRATVMLLRADISTKWFKLGDQFANEIRFLTGGRVDFIHPETLRPGKMNRMGSLLLIFTGYPTRRAKLTTMELPK